jgi:hypothetical protein
MRKMVENGRKKTVFDEFLRVLVVDGIAKGSFQLSALSPQLSGLGQAACGPACDGPEPYSKEEDLPEGTPGSGRMPVDSTAIPA